MTVLHEVIGLHAFSQTIVADLDPFDVQKVHQCLDDGASTDSDICPAGTYLRKLASLGCGHGAQLPHKCFQFGTGDDIRIHIAAFGGTCLGQHLHGTG